MSNFFSFDEFRKFMMEKEPDRFKPLPGKCGCGTKKYKKGKATFLTFFKSLSPHLVFFRCMHCGKETCRVLVHPTQR